MKILPTHPCPYCETDINCFRVKPAENGASCPQCEETLEVNSTYRFNLIVFIMVFVFVFPVFMACMLNAMYIRGVLVAFAFFGFTFALAVWEINQRTTFAKKEVANSSSSKKKQAKKQKKSKKKQ